MMKKTLLSILLLLSSVGVFSQDFASSFLEGRSEDDNLECVSVSPKMIQQVLKIETDDQNDEILKIISNLKSMQILTADTGGKEYYSEALNIFRKNTDQFETLVSHTDDAGEYYIIIKKKRSKIHELIMLVNAEEKFIMIDFTGKMNEKFINRIAQSVDLQQIK